MKTSYSTTRNKKTTTASSSSSSSSSSHTGPRDAAAGDDEDEVDEVVAAMCKIVTQPTNAEERQFSRTLEAYIADHGGPRAILQRSGEGEEGPYHSSNNNSNNKKKRKKKKKKKKKHTNNNNEISVAAAEDEVYNTTARALLEDWGFDPDNINKICQIRGWSTTPMIFFCSGGNLKMCRYLLSRGADCRKTDTHGQSPMHIAARDGHLDVIQWLSQVSSAIQDIGRVTNEGFCPLVAALYSNHVDVVNWLVLNGALAPHDDVDGGGIDDMVMRRDLRQYDGWEVHDKRETVLLWAQTSVANHDHAVQLLFTRMIASSKQTASPLAIFNGQAGILKLIADYGVIGSPQQLRTLRQLMVLLPAFIDDTPFVEGVYDDDEDEDEDEDEGDY